MWEIYRRQLEDSDKALRTWDRYDYVAAKITVGPGGVRVSEATTQRLDGFIRTLAERNGPSVARTAKVLLSGILKLAVRYGATTENPVRDVSAVSMATKASRALTVGDLRAILRGMATSTRPGAGRRGTSRVKAVTAKVIRAKGRGLILEGTTKSEAGKRVLPLPAFALAILLARQVAAAANPHDVVFPSQVGMLRDPDNRSKK